MFTFLKAQLSSIAATLVDFLVTISLVEGLHCWYVFGSVVGTITGGCTHFMLGRNWVFKAGEREIQTQALKYLLVWIVYLCLSTAGVYIITHYAGVNYLISKVCVTVVLSVGYNYVLHKKFVFK
jgi:putative flippase GtrA